ncbi:hypothetical protein QQF64_006040 [Cirrhinus molitorella]|uniref:Reverse transcriptase/retrotransposon-derived protein RNase H-like domain-containing protein n=1 Tax=Cirrhinus molitorella TaxID=172907 RepID=A0ABR3ME18_9TELE
MYLGREVGQGQVKPTEAQFPVPTMWKELCRFLGMAGYYLNFCKNFSTVANPLTSLLSPSQTFLWTDVCQDVFDNVKALLCSAPVLATPDVSKGFKLEIDASSVGAGAVLVQEDSSGIDHPLCYFSLYLGLMKINICQIECGTLRSFLTAQRNQHSSF